MTKTKQSEFRALASRLHDDFTTMYFVLAGHERANKKEVLNVDETQRLMRLGDLPYSLSTVRLIRQALAWIDDFNIEIDSPPPSNDEQDFEPDVYNSDLIAWLAEDLRHINYCQEALEMWVDTGSDYAFINAIAEGQRIHMIEVADKVFAALKQMVKEESE
jgi:hypothetical protein